MPRNLEYVPYGYEPPKPTTKGTLIFYDLFEQVQEDLEQAVAILEERSFVKLVLYPSHEETAKRMFKEPVSPITSGRNSFRNGSKIMQDHRL